MKVLLVIHGYPPHYKGGSEIYTQTLAHGLKDAGVNVTVFTREEDPFLPDYYLRKKADPLRTEIPVYLMNHARSNLRFHNIAIDNVFQQVLDEIRPDVVHFGHLNHLSTGLIEVAKEMGAKVIFTLHDYWLMCPRGQFLQWGLSSEEPGKLCDGQENLKCAVRCFNRYTTGLNGEESISYWVQWVQDRMAHIREMCKLVDLFLAPSRYLMRRHMEEFGLNPDKISYLDYGFDYDRLKGRNRINEEYFVFGYIGRHHPSKGINHLIEAFRGLEESARLRIWGQHDGQLTQSLRRKANELIEKEDSIEWLEEYHNEDITREVFDRCDCIVVPSIWDENSPLVIHEAQQAGVPVITAAHGGMGEYVKDGVNGLTYIHRDVEDLRQSIRQGADGPSALSALGKRGYLYSGDGSVPSINSHVEEVLRFYSSLLDSDFETMEEALCH